MYFLDAVHTWVTAKIASVMSTVLDYGREKQATRMVYIVEAAIIAMDLRTVTVAKDTRRFF